MFTPIVMTLLAMKLPTNITQAPSQPTVLKTKKKRVARTLTIKKSEVNPPATIIDLTVEVEQSIPTTTIIEEIPTTTSSTLH